MNHKSFNVHAGLNWEELQHAEKILTQYRWFTRNEFTDMKAPLDKRLLHDRKFINIAEGFIRKQIQAHPKLAKTLKYTTNQSKQGKKLGLNIQGQAALMNLNEGLSKTRPLTATMRQVPIIEKKDRVKKKDADYFDRKT